MLGTQFQDEAKGFADAMIAGRAAMILYRVSGAKRIELEHDDIQIINDAIKILSSSLSGLEAAKGEASHSEMGFLEWMENLRHYEAAFDAVVRSKLAVEEEEVPKTLIAVKKKLEGILAGARRKRTLRNLGQGLGSIGLKPNSGQGQR